ncbi:MAG: hypothetical protein ABEK59_10455 [Halobacteria archaeon]
MSKQGLPGPNPVVRETYRDLEALLEDGDDVFVEEGPEVIQQAIEDREFFDGVSTESAGGNGYTRSKVIGEPGKHVIRFMEWAPGFSIFPHEHHGRPCFEVLVDGLLNVVDMDVAEADRNDDLYEMDVIETKTTDPGEAAVVDPRITEIHSVYSPVRSRSLHVYPDDKYYTYGYVFEEKTQDGEDLYRRKKFSMD